jgi:hypothetical protein
LRNGARCCRFLARAARDDLAWAFDYDPYRPLIDEWLPRDRKAGASSGTRPSGSGRLQEQGADVAETTVCGSVRRRRRELGDPVGDIYVAQVHEPGAEPEVDWDQTVVEIKPRYIYLVHAYNTTTGRVFAQSNQVRLQVNRPAAAIDWRPSPGSRC